MHPRFYDYYNSELEHLRNTAVEFGREHRKVAGRLALDANGETPDPYVERLLEGFAFMAARVQLRFDAEFPAFTQHLMEMLYPDFLAPTPSMAVVRFNAESTDAALLDGISIPRGTHLSSRLCDGVNTVCEFRTAHALRIWPIVVASTAFQSRPPSLPRGLRVGADIASHITLNLDLTVGEAFAQLPLDELTFHFGGTEIAAHRLAEVVLSSCVGVLVGDRSGKTPAVFLPADALRPCGFDDDEAMLPLPARQFRGYRLLREYAAFPARYLFFRISGLRAAFAKCGGKQVVLTLLFSRSDTRLEAAVDINSLLLYATPAVNLFTKSIASIAVSDKLREFHVVADRVHLANYEIFSLNSVVGGGTGLERELRFRPLYAAVDQGGQIGSAYYTLRREPRMLPSNSRSSRDRTGYAGTEVYIGIVDTQAPPFPEGLQSLAIEALCTNRDLPTLLQFGGNRDFAPKDMPPYITVDCVRRPTRPIAPHIEGDLAWRTISHLALNYLSLTEAEPQQGADALRMILKLYGVADDAPLRRQIDAIRSVKVRPIVRRLPLAGPVAFGRGQEIELLIEERLFEGGSPTLFAGVMAEFLRRYASINSFVETVLTTVENREIKRWPAKIGKRPVL